MINTIIRCNYFVAAFTCGSLCRYLYSMHKIKRDLELDYIICGRYWDIDFKNNKEKYFNKVEDLLPKYVFQGKVYKFEQKILNDTCLIFLRQQIKKYNPDQVTFDECISDICVNYEKLTTIYKKFNSWNEILENLQIEWNRIE